MKLIFFRKTFVDNFLWFLFILSPGYFFYLLQIAFVFSREFSFHPKMGKRIKWICVAIIWWAHVQGLISQVNFAVWPSCLMNKIKNNHLSHQITSLISFHIEINSQLIYLFIYPKTFLNWVSSTHFCEKCFLSTIMNRSSSTFCNVRQFTRKCI